MTTTEYYNKHAEAFHERTIGRDTSSHRARFLHHLAPAPHLLDAGCGNGRDSLAFLQEGCQMVAFDGAKELVRLAKEVTGLEVLLLKFQELVFENRFDGIWANASLLHVPYDELRDVLLRLHRSLKPSGILYASFKKGNSHRRVEERHFYDQDEKSFLPFVEAMFDPVEQWESEDVGRAANTTKRWFHVILKKIGR